MWVGDGAGCCAPRYSARGGRHVEIKVTVFTARLVTLITLALLGNEHGGGGTVRDATSSRSGDVPLSRSCRWEGPEVARRIYAVTSPSSRIARAAAGGVAALPPLARPLCCAQSITRGWRCRRSAAGRPGGLATVRRHDPPRPWQPLRWGLKSRQVLAAVTGGHGERVTVGRIRGGRDAGHGDPSPARHPGGGTGPAGRASAAVRRAQRFGAAARDSD